MPFVKEKHIRSDIEKHGVYYISDYEYKMLPLKNRGIHNTVDQSIHSDVKKVRACAIVDTNILMNTNGVCSTVGLLKYLATALGSEGFGYGHHLVNYILQENTFTRLYTIFPVDRKYISATKSCYGNMEESEELQKVLERVANEPNEFFKTIGFQPDEKDQKNFWISDRKSVV